MSSIIMHDKKQITVKEFSSITGISVKTINRYLSKFYPEKVKHGKTTYLNESMITRIKLEYQYSGRKDLVNVEQVRNVNTDLEKRLVIKQAMQFLEEDIKLLKRENEEKSKTLNLLMKNNNLFTSTQVGQELGISAKKLHTLLKDRGYIYFQSGTWIGTLKIKNKGYLTTKETLDINKKIYYHSYWTEQGRLWILNQFKNSQEDIWT